MECKEITFDRLRECDLEVDATYKGGSRGNSGDDPICRLLNCSNQGGFRYRGCRRKGQYSLVVLYSSLDDTDWPDDLDLTSGTFTYYGDNKDYGGQLHETRKGGNVLLRHCFDRVYSSDPERLRVPPFFIFTRGEKGRDVVFRGIAVPGTPALNPMHALVAEWRTKGQHRFQNYRAMFTILDIPVVTRAWVEDLKHNDIMSSNCPEAWYRWVTTGEYVPLIAKRTVEYRSKTEQLPSSAEHADVVRCIYDYFKSDPYAFEDCAAAICRLMDSNITRCDCTRRWADGGRDATGEYRIRGALDEIAVDFALEAKCYALDNGVGVKETARLIARLRYRQFGILVTTSYVSPQAYREIKEDRQPVIIVAGEDIVRILLKAGLSTRNRVQEWLVTEFPTERRRGL